MWWPTLTRQQIINKNYSLKVSQNRITLVRVTKVARFNIFEFGTRLLTLLCCGKQKLTPNLKTPVFYTTKARVTVCRMAG